jgi:acyl-coenzyme A synthetase/AMP-(fatty) acid ligase
MVIDELEVLTQMPRTASGKIDRGVLVARYEAQRREVADAVAPAQLEVRSLV